MADTSQLINKNLSRDNGKIKIHRALRLQGRLDLFPLPRTTKVKASRLAFDVPPSGHPEVRVSAGTICTLTMFSCSLTGFALKSILP